MQTKKMGKTPKIKKNETNVINVPFKKAGDLINVKVLVNGIERDFLLDSGAPTLILNSYYYKSETTKEGKNNLIPFGVNGEITGADFFEIENINFSGIQINEQEIMTLDLKHLESELDCEVYGLIGYEVIKEYDVLFDYENEMITLIKPDEFQSYQKTYLDNYSIQTVPIELKAHIPVLKIKIGKKELLVGIDSGAEENVIDDSLIKLLKKSMVDIKTDTLVGADNISAEIISCKIKESKISERIFVNLKTYFSSISHLNSAYTLNIEGIIGYPVLSKQKTLLSFKRQELVFIE